MKKGKGGAKTADGVANTEGQNKAFRMKNSRKIYMR